MPHSTNMPTLYIVYCTLSAVCSAQFISQDELSREQELYLECLIVLLVKMNLGRWANGEKGTRDVSPRVCVYVCESSATLQSWQTTLICWDFGFAYVFRGKRKYEMVCMHIYFLPFPKLVYTQ